MKRIIATTISILCLIICANCSEALQKSDRTKNTNESSEKNKKGIIKAETTKIVYGRHSNSGIAIETTYELYRDSLTWDYVERRNDCHLHDVATYDTQDFETLISALSTLSFSAKDMHDLSAGGDGYGYSFSTVKGIYLSFNDTFKLSGDIEKLIALIDEFIESHLTPAESLFRKLSEEPHERPTFGEFEELPQELTPYKIERTNHLKHK